MKLEQLFGKMVGGTCLSWNIDIGSNNQIHETIGGEISAVTTAEPGFLVHMEVLMEEGKAPIMNGAGWAVISANMPRVILASSSGAPIAEKKTTSLTVQFQPQIVPNLIGALTAHVMKIDFNGDVRLSVERVNELFKELGLYVRDYELTVSNQFDKELQLRAYIL